MQTIYKNNFAAKFVTAFILSMVLAFTSFNNASAQSTANYSFTTGANGSLALLADGTTAVDMSTGTTSLIGANIDDAAATITNLNLGSGSTFNFPFMGASYNQFNVSSNGYLSLGNGALGGTLYALPNGTVPTITAFGNDMQTGTDGSVVAKIVGTAPNRTLVVQWTNVMIRYTAANESGTGTWQMRLYESNGMVEFVYGAMTTNTASPTVYYVGFSNNTTANNIVSVNTTTNVTNNTASPTTNSYTASSTITALHSLVNGSQRFYRFTPPPAPTVPITFATNTVTGNSFNITWTDNSTSESAFRVYRSTDNVTFTQVGSDVASTTSAGTGTSYSLAQTGLLPSTTYYYRISAIAEMESSFLTGNQTTSAPGIITSIQSGNWSATSTWSGGVVPTSTDNVTIADGHTVTVDAAAATFGLTVGGGTSGSLIFEAATGRTLTTNSNVIINAGATLASAATGTITSHVFIVGGNLTNNGSINFSTNTNTAGAALQFNGATNNTFTGSGTTNLRSIIMNKGSGTITRTSPMLDLNLTNAPTFGVINSTTTGLTTTTFNGILRISGSNTWSTQLFGTVGYTIPSTGGLWLNNSNLTITAQAGSPTLTGLLRVTNGTLNIGTATGNSMGFSSGSIIIVEGGAINAAGRFGVASAANTISYVQSAGTITVCTVGNTSASLASFDLGTSTSSTDTITGGNIIIQLVATGTTVMDFRGVAIANTASTITGGTLQFGNSSSGTAKTFFWQGGIGPNITVSNASGNHNLTVNVASQVNGNYTQSAGTLNINLVNLTFRGGISTSGTTVTANGTGSGITFQGSSAQTFTPGTLTSNQIANVTVNNTAGVTITASVQINASLTLTAGNLSSGGTLTLGNAGTNTFNFSSAGGTLSGTVTRNYGTGSNTFTYNSAAAQTTGVELPATITSGSLVINNTGAGVTLNAALTVPTLTLTNGVLNCTNTNFVTVTDSTNSGVTGGSATSYVNGPLVRTLRASTVGRTYIFPVGKSRNQLFEMLNPITGTSLNTVLARVEAFDADPAGTISPAFTGLTNNRYWQVTLSGSGSISGNGTVRVSDTLMTSSTRIGQSVGSVPTGTYANIGGSALTPGTRNSSLTNVLSLANYGTGSNNTYFITGTAGAFTAGTYSIGTSGGAPYTPPGGGSYAANYTSLTAAMADINNGAVASGPIVLELQNTYTSSSETFPIFCGYKGTSTNTLTIRPRSDQSTTLNINGTSTAQIIDLNGANYVTIDGRGAASANVLTVTNLSPASSASTVRFINDAKNNNLTFCTVQGASGSASTSAVTTGVVTFGTGITTGNDSNTVSNCNITVPAATAFNFNGTTSTTTLTVTSVSGGGVLTIGQVITGGTLSAGTIITAYGTGTGSTGTYTISQSNTNATTVTYASTGALYPQNGIYSAGTSTAINNSGNIVTNNNVSDYYNPAVASNGINLTSTGNSTWTITNNKLFQTASKNYTSAAAHTAITVGTGSGYTINNNTIGYANASGTGNTLMIGSSAPLGLGAGAGFPSSYTTAGTATSITFTGINTTFTAGGLVSDLQGNTVSGIGLYTSSTSSSSNGILCGIAVAGGNANIGTTTGNTIGAASGRSALHAAVTSSGGAVVGIFANSTNAIAIQNNVIGAIDAVGTTATTNASITGIDVGSSGGASGTTIQSNNFIGNTDTSNIRTGYLFNGTNLGTAGTLTSTTGTSSIIGIRSTATGNTYAANNNILRNWSTSGTVTSVTGIVASGAMAGTNPTVNMNNNQVGTTTADFIRYTAPNSGTLIGLSFAQTVATTHYMQGNDIRRIVYYTPSSGAHTYLTATGGTAANDSTDIRNNTFTNLDVNTTGSITFISHSYLVAATGKQIINNNSIVTAFNKGGAGGTVTLATSSSSSAAGALITHSNNNFSNITVTGATTIAGWVSTDGGTANKTYISNVFDNWRAGTSPVTAMSISNGGGNGGNGNVVSRNKISNFITNGNITGISLGSSGTTHTALQDTINDLSSSGASAVVTGIVLNGGAVTANVAGNKIYNLSCSGATPLVSGISISGTTANNTNNIFNNLIGNLTATVGSNGTTDVVRGISITSTAATTNHNIINNTIRLSGAGGTNFSSSGIFHTANSTSTTSALNSRNNIIINLGTQSGTGIVTALRRSAVATLANIAATTNKNMLFAGSNSIMHDGTTAFTLATYKSALTSPAREVSSFANEGTYDYSAVSGVNQFFKSITGSSVDYLHVVDGLATQVEGGADPISTPAITVDYDGDARNATTPDVGADEFNGTTPTPSITNVTVPTATCDATDHVINATIIPVSGTLSGTPQLTYNIGQGNVAINMSNPSGNTWTATIPAATNPKSFLVTWSINAANTSGYNTTFNGTSYRDSAMALISNISAAASPTSVCAGSNITLNAVAITSAAIATSTTTIGGADGNPYRSGNGTGNQIRVQNLITAAQLTAAGITAGNLTSVALNVTSTTGTLANFEIQIGATSLNALTTSYITGLTTVFTQSTFTPVTGLNTHTFTTPFFWNGTSNIVINFCQTNSLSGTTTVSAYTPPVSQCINTASSTTSCTATTGTLITTAPVLTFGFNGFSPYNTAWVDASNTQLATTPSTTVSAATTQAYKFRITSLATGCIREYPTATVTVNPIPVNPTFTGTVTSQCGTPITVVANSNLDSVRFNLYRVATGGSPVATDTAYNLGGSTTKNLLVSLANVNLGTDNDYYLEVVNLRTGCVSARAFTGDDFYTINVTSPNSISISTDNNSTCQNRVQTIWVDTTGSRYERYTWSSPTANTLFTNIAATAQFAYVPGTYASQIFYKRATTGSDIVTVTGADLTGNRCVNTQSTTMTVNANPLVTSVTPNAPATICSGTTVNLSAQTTDIAAGTVTVGAGSTTTSTYNAPFYSAWSNKRMQIMIKAAELTAANLFAGNITSISFPTTSGTVSNKDYTLKMRNATGISDMSAFVTSGFTTVYTATEVLQTANTDNTITFTTPFNWDGSSDIIIEMCWGDASTTATLSSTSPADATTYVSVIKTHISSANSGSTICADGSTNLVTYSVRPRIRFGGQTVGLGVGNLAWSWAATTSAGINAGTLPNASSGSVTPNNSNTYGTNGTVLYSVTGVSPVAPNCSTTVNASLQTIRTLPTALVDSGTIDNSLQSQCGQARFFVTTPTISGYTIKWYANNTTTTTLQSGTSNLYILNTYVPLQNNVLYATVTDANGCESPRTAVTVYVTNPPALTISNQNTTVSGCINKIETISVLNDTTGLGFTSFAWTPNANLYVASNATGTRATNQLTVYYRRSTTSAGETVTLTGSAGACTATAVVTFTVGTNPVISSVTANPASVCAGSSVALNGQSIIASSGTAAMATSTTTIGGADGNPYRSGNGVGNQIRVQNLITAAQMTAAGFTTGNITSVALNVTSTSGTLANFEIQMGTTSLTALTTSYVTGLTSVFTQSTFTPVTGLNTHTLSTPFFWDGTSNIVINFCQTNSVSGTTTVSAYTPSVSQCVGTATSTTSCTATTGTLITTAPVITFGGQIGTNQSNTFNWSWSGSNGQSTTGNPATITPTNNTSSNINVTYVGRATNPTSGCFTEMTTSAVVVRPLPDMPTITSASTQCGLPTFSVSTSVTSPVFKWFATETATTPIVGATSSTYNPSTFTLGAINSYWVSVTNVSGCESVRRQVDVTLNTPPAIEADANVRNICSDGVITLSVTNATVSNYSSFVWTTGTGVNQYQYLFTDANATSAYNGTGNLTTVYYKRSTTTDITNTVVTLTVNDGASPICYNSDTVQLSINAKPNIGTIAASPNPVCSGEVVNLSATAVGIGAGTVTLGTGTATGTGINGTFLRQGNTVGNQFRTQYLFRASELIAAGLGAGNITGISWDISAAGGGTASNLTFKMGHTNLTALTTSYVTGLTQVFNVATYPATGTVPAGVQGVTFNVPFVWDGVSNIVLEGCSQLATTGSGGDLRGTVTSYVSTIGNTAAANECANSTSSSSTFSERPNFIFNGQTVANVTAGFNWGWKVGTTTVGTADAITTHTPTNTGIIDSTQTYTVTATNPSNNCSATRDTSITLRSIPTIVTTNSGANVCGVPTFTATANQSVISYNWYTFASNIYTLIATTTSPSYLYTGYSSTLGGTVNTLYVSASNASCESPKVRIDITASTPPAVSVATSSGTSNINSCQNRTERLVASGSGYTNYIWTPITNLFKDSAGTMPYNGTDNEDTIYYRRSSITVSTDAITVVANGNGCQNTSTVLINVRMNPNMTSAVASPSTVCAGSTVNLSATSINSISDVATIGAGSTTTSTYNAPFYSLWSNKRMQILIKSAELSASNLVAGNITSIGFPTTSGTVSNKDYTLKMRSSNGVADMSAFVTSGFTTVFTAPNVPQTAGTDNTINFTTPFNWDGTSDIIIEMCWGDASTTTTLSSTSPADATSYISVIKNNFTTASSGSTICANATNSIVTYSVRPQIKLGGQVGTNVTGNLVWTWNDGTISVGSTSNITTATAASGTTSYNVVAYNPVTTCTNTRSTNAITVNPMPSTPTSTTVSSQCGTPTYTVSPMSGFSFRWYTLETGGTPISGATSSSYTWVGAPVNQNDTLWVSAVNTSTLCEGQRARIIVNVSAPLPISLSANATATCQNRVQTLSVSSTIGNFTNYAFSPITNLYIDANATVPYNVNSNATTVYYKNPAVNSADVITLTGSNPTTAPFCVNVTTISFNVRPNPVVDTLKISPNTGSICSGTSVVLNGITNGSVQGLDSVISGTATTISTTGLTPFSGSYEAVHVQYLIRASDLIARRYVAGSMTNMSFKVSSKASSSPYTGFTIKLANTSVTTMTAAYLNPTFTTVYQAPIVTDNSDGYTTTLGRNTFVFGTGGTSSSFIWDGVSNLLVDVCFSNDDATNRGVYFTSNDIVSATTKSYTCTFGTYSDNANLCGSSGTSAGTSTSLPDMLFTGAKYANVASDFTWNWTNTIGSTLASTPSITNIPSTINGSSLAYTAVVTNAATSCSTTVSTTPQNLNAAGVTPTISISIGGNNTTVCSGNNVTFTANVYSGSINATLQWRKNGTNISGATSSTYVAPPNSLITGDVISCFLNTNNPCSTPSSLSSNNITVTVNQSPAAAAIYNGVNNALIPGNAVTYCNFGVQQPYYVDPSRRGGTWSVSDPTVLTIANGSSTTSLSSSGEIRTLKNGTAKIIYSLPSTVNSCVTNTEVNVTVAKQDKPTPSTTTSSFVCVGNSLVFSNATNGGTWSTSGVQGVMTGNVLTARAAVTALNVFYTLTNAAGCANRDTFTVAIRALPNMPNIAFAQPTTNPFLGAPSGNICNNRSFNLQGLPGNGVWSSSNNARLTVNQTSTNATASFATVSSVGLGTANLSYQYTHPTTTCSNTRVVTFSIAACATRGATPNLTAKDNIASALFPNPAKNVVNLRMDMLVGKGEVIVTDLLGKNVKSQMLSLGNNEIDIATLAPGMYLVNIITTSGKQVQKLVIE